MESEFHAILKKKLVDVGEARFNLAHEQLLNLIIDADILLGTFLASGRAFSQKEWDTLSSIFDDLIHYTKIHFSEEEGYLRSHDYPDTNQHQLEHHALVERLNENQKKLTLNDESVLKNVRVWLLEWLINHVNNKDYAYAQFFINKK